MTLINLDRSELESKKPCNPSSYDEEMEKLKMNNMLYVFDFSEEKNRIKNMVKLRACEFNLGKWFER